MKAQSKCFPITRNARRWWIAVALLAAPVVSLAQTDEIQVYDANIADKGKFNLMIHNNFTPDGRKSVFFEPKTKYIWDMVVGPDGTLYVATGDTGKIFAVTRRFDALILRIDPGRSSQEKALRGRKAIIVKENRVWAVR